MELKFVKELDTANEMVVYSKLPRGFLIPTPVGDYNPDWAIAFKEGTVKHIYFVAETKGSMSTMELREIEMKKIQCARKFFDEINKRYAPEKVKYDVLDSFGKLTEIVKYLVENNVRLGRSRPKPGDRPRKISDAAGNGPRSENVLTQ